MVVKTLLIASLRKIGAIASGETPDNEELQDALESLQVMLRAWATKRILVHASTQESFSLVSGTASYSWGSGGTITTARPHSVISAFVRDSGNTDHLVDIVSEGKYKAYSNKAVTGRPEAAFYLPSYPLGYLYMWPTPEDAEAVWITTLKPFTETSSFDSMFSSLAFPTDYEEPIIYNLAVRLAPEYGKSIPAEVAAIASSSYDNLVSFNSGNQVEPIYLSLPITTGRGRYDINSG